MSDEKNEAPKTSSKKAKKADDPKPEIKLAVTVLENHTKIGAMLCLKGKKAAIPESKAKALEKLGKVRIDGVA